MSDNTGEVPGEEIKPQREEGENTPKVEEKVKEEVEAEKKEEVTENKEPPREEP